MGLQRRHKSSAGRSILIFCFGALTLGQWSTPLLVIRKEHTKYSFFFSDCHYIYIFGKLLTFEKHFEVSIRLSTFLSSCHMICARLLVFQSNLSFRWVLEYLYLSSVSTSTTMMLMGIVPVFFPSEVSQHLWHSDGGGDFIRTIQQSSLPDSCALISAHPQYTQPMQCCQSYLPVSACCTSTRLVSKLKRIDAALAQLKVENIQIWVKFTINFLWNLTVHWAVSWRGKSEGNPE